MSQLSDRVKELEQRVTELESAVEGLRSAVPIPALARTEQLRLGIGQAELDPRFDPLACRA